MAKISYSPRFKRNYKKLMRKHYDMNKIDNVIRLLAEENFEILRKKFDDHELKGNLLGKNAVHIESNWILVYEKSYQGEYHLLEVLLISTGNHDDYSK